MKVKTIEYSRLFNLSNYNNERISVVIELDDSDNEMQAWEQAYKKVMALHAFFEMHRAFLSAFSEAVEGVRNTMKRKKAEELELLELQKRHEEMQRKIEAWRKGELDPHAVDE